MTTKKSLYKQIESMYPDFGTHGVDFDVEYDKVAKAWAVDLRNNKYHLKTYLESDEIDQCVKGKQCVPFGLQISQLKGNLKKYMREHAL